MKRRVGLCEVSDGADKYGVKRTVGEGHGLQYLVDASPIFALVIFTIPAKPGFVEKKHLISDKQGSIFYIHRINNRWFFIDGGFLTGVNSPLTAMRPCIRFGHDPIVCVSLPGVCLLIGEGKGVGRI